MLPAEGGVRNLDILKALFAADALWSTSGPCEFNGGTVSAVRSGCVWRNALHSQHQRIRAFTARAQLGSRRLARRTAQRPCLRQHQLLRPSVTVPTRAPVPGCRNGALTLADWPSPSRAR